eukprot:4034481-Lingulodinium_polyedra.AAC.1
MGTVVVIEGAAEGEDQPDLLLEALMAQDLHRGQQRVLAPLPHLLGIQRLLGNWACIHLV